MSKVSDIRDICGDYAIDIKYHEGQKEAITLFFNSRRNAETVKRCIEVDDSVPNVATVVDFVEVVRCKDCKQCEVCADALLWCNQIERLVPPMGYCHCGERSEGNENNI